jgi:hypothetical protein
MISVEGLVSNASNRHGGDDNPLLTLHLSRTGALFIEMVSTPLPHQPPRQLKPNNPLTHA